MDTKHRPVYLRVKLPGDKSAHMIEGTSMIQAIQGLMRLFVSAPARYGDFQIEGSFEPLDQHLTSQQQAYKELLSGLDPSLIEMETDEEAANPKHWDNSPANPTSAIYDPMFHEYLNCTSPAHRATKTPADLALLRNHMEKFYSDSIWWDKSHRW